MEVSRLKLCFFVSLLNTAKVTAQKSTCKTLEGEVGRCVDFEMCPKALTKCEGNFVCCPMMGRIVTPDGTPSPIIQSTIPPARPSTTRQPTTTSHNPIIPNIAAAKCEEYKHRMKKRSSIITYVFGGTASMGKEFPHMALLGYGSPSDVEWLCGGSLISEQFVLTAAHCLVNSNLGQLVLVRLGELDLASSVDDASPRDFGVSQKYIYPNYRPPLQYNDIALLRLSGGVQFNDYIAPICLETNKNLPNYKFIASGWGRTELGGSHSDILMKVDLEYFTNEECRRNYEGVSPEALPKGIMDDIQICAGSRSAEKDTCQGDSGGPLQIRNDGLVLVGITSFGKVCGIPNSPGVYTRVSSYIPWIEGIVWTSP